ncbi:MAG: hypothetical protein GKS03_01225 [Alphaproteobacteria bacterium]|nr:hypothetical protein [Alphaproteobacteria bacterium]
MRHLFLALVFLPCFAATATAQDQPPLQRDLMIISELFPGTYDNMEQVYFDNRLEVSEDIRHERVSSEVRRIPNDRFGENAFFILDYWFEQDRWHPRIYSFHVDQAENAIRMRLHSFAGFDRTPYLRAHEDLSALDSLSPDDLTNLAQCDLFWRQSVGGYHAKMKDKACVYEEQGETVYADYQMMLSDRALWKGDVIRRVSDDSQINSEPEVLHKQLKARHFTCNMSFSGETGKKENFGRIPIHDQGGLHFVSRPTKEKPDRQIGIRLRNVDWAMNNTATGFTNDVFVMYIVERASGQKDRNVTYTWGAPEETSVGLNLQWLLASCYITPQNQTRPYLTRTPAGPWQSPSP